jgi:Putative adhesin
VRYPAVLALTALAVSGCGFGVHFVDYRHRITPPDTHVNGPVSLVVVKGDNGRVNVTTGGDGVTIHRVVHYQSGHPRPSQQLSGGTLTFTDGCRRCSIDYDLTVPASAGVQAATDSGRINVTGVASVQARTDSGAVAVRQVKGEVNASTDSGSATVEHVTGAVTGRTDSGGLTITDIAGPLTVTTSSGGVSGSGIRSASVHASSDSGGIRLLFAAAPGLIQANTDSGSLRVAVPGGPYEISANTDSGGKDIAVPTDPNARSHLTLRTDSGHITVEPS